MLVLVDTSHLLWSTIVFQKTTAPLCGAGAEEEIWSRIFRTLNTLCPPGGQ